MAERGSGDSSKFGPHPMRLPFGLPRESHSPTRKSRLPMGTFLVNSSRSTTVRNSSRDFGVAALVTLTDRDRDHELDTRLIRVCQFGVCELLHPMTLPFGLPREQQSPTRKSRLPMGTSLVNSTRSMVRDNLRDCFCIAALILIYLLIFSKRFD